MAREGAQVLVGAAFLRIEVANVTLAVSPPPIVLVCASNVRVTRRHEVVRQPRPRPAVATAATSAAFTSTQLLPHGFLGKLAAVVQRDRDLLQVRTAH